MSCTAFCKTCTSFLGVTHDLLISVYLMNHQIKPAMCRGIRTVHNNTDCKLQVLFTSKDLTESISAQSVFDVTTLWHGIVPSFLASFVTLICWCLTCCTWGVQVLKADRNRLCCTVKFIAPPDVIATHSWVFASSVILPAIHERCLLRQWSHRSTLC